ncbi:MAG: cation transporter, partial [Candidatus Lokiarchaeota archaeon]|nr:cation transporter [Candidatus Lokiarchaeota archaeon]
TNSVALQADAFDSMTDIVMALTALIALLFTRKKPNEKFPYGYYKLENIISLFISLFIFFTAYNIVIQSVTNISALFSGQLRVIYSSPLIFLFLILSLSISLFIALYLKKISKRTGSPIIEFEAREKLFDCLISSSVIISFIGALWNLNFLDSIIALIIAVFIFKGGYDIFLISTKTLLDAVINFDKRTELIKTIEEYPMVKSLESIQVRSYGKYVFMQADILLKKDMTLSQIRALKDTLSNKIKAEFPEIFKVILLAYAQE